jgi:hypothetical protein
LGEKLQLARRDSVIHRNRAPALEWFYKMHINFLRFAELFWYQTSLTYAKCVIHLSPSLKKASDNDRYQPLNERRMQEHGQRTKHEDERAPPETSMENHATAVA